ncbi:MAG: class I SAM-dependent methyltransferase [Paracoccus sp. (in: a-proteobacteria)]|uniref:class I SAM-dependent methyltransferase n=1 Tax=Paracoccus sp. TaxID=267 RepID=UPI0040580242
MDWNERFSREEFHFGEAPAAFVRDHLGGLGAGAHVLTIAEGEGRNAVWLARQGCRVTAIEPTGTGREKAMALAARHGVTMEWRQESLESYGWPSNGFDVVLGCFFQFADPRLRAEILAGMARTTMPGGTVFLHGFSTRQLGNGSGGPRSEPNLWTPDRLLPAFPGWQVVRAEDYDAVLDEGPGHSGPAALVDVIVRKPGRP